MAEVEIVKKKSRLTVDMSSDEHMYLKMASAKQGVSMKEFILCSAFEKIEELEDEWLASKAKDVLKDIRSGKEKLIPWEDFKDKVL